MFVISLCIRHEVSKPSYVVSFPTQADSAGPHANDPSSRCNWDPLGISVYRCKDGGGKSAAGRSGATNRQISALPWKCPDYRLSDQ